MAWMATSERVAACFEESSLLQMNGVTVERAREIVERLGFCEVSFDGMEKLREVVGKAQYRRGAHPNQAPEIFDCSSLVKWWYGLHGIKLRRYALDQREQGRVVSKEEETRLGDLIFSRGHWGRYYTDPEDGVGHVGICTGQQTVIHAASSDVGVIEVSVSEFCPDDSCFRGVRRFFPFHELFVYGIPSDKCVEYTTDLEWSIIHCL